VTWLWVVAALAFGAADQYLGSFSTHPLGADVSGLVGSCAVATCAGSRRRRAS